MESKKILNEDDLLRYYLHTYARNSKQFFPQVHTISTSPISPDIDLLYIDDSRKLVVGHEFKLLRYRKNWKRVDYSPIYAGIGEALLYFNFGVDQCYLVLGLAEMPPEWENITLKKIDQALEALNALTKLFTDWSEFIHFVKRDYPFIGSEEKNWGLGCFGVKVWSERYGLNVIKKADQFYPVDNLYSTDRNPDIQHKRECLLRGEFRYKKKFFHS